MLDQPARELSLPLACGTAALLLLLPASLAPLLRLTSFGIVRRDWLPTGAAVLWSEGHEPLSAVVLLFSMAIPAAFLGLTVSVLGALRWARPFPLGRLFRWSVSLRQWAMIEVYLVGCCVAWSRLQSIGDIDVGAGGWCLMGAAFATLLMVISLDDRAVWDALPSRSRRVGATPGAPRAGRAIACGSCDLLLDESFEDSPCPRCSAKVRRRRAASLTRTLALVIAGFLLYVPANLLPVLDIERFGRTQPNTILSGVQELVTAGLWPLAAVVFTASVVVPLMKLCGLTFMLVLTHRGSRRWLIGRTRLYRVIDLIGRWSSIDLFMISILAAIVQFGALTSVRAADGATAFAAVVVVTMFASRGFDPRVMWDAAAEPGR